jgi:glycine oxidase
MHGFQMDAAQLKWDAKDRADAAPIRMPETQIVIAGGGIIGLSLALELHARGFPITVLEHAQAMAQASTAAAGMLAVDDPHNPPSLLPFSRYSASLYPDYLQRLQNLSGLAVPFQTHLTIQHLEDGHTLRLPENSLDPRQLAAALLAAVRATSIPLREHETCTPNNLPPETKFLIHATGAWFQHPHNHVFPRKGQMLRVQLPLHLNLQAVHRSGEAYIVPRTTGPQAGTALIGSTVEDAGFDLTTHPTDLRNLRQLASRWVPDVASETNAPTIEAWAGIRPATHDNLPLIGELPPSATSPHLRQFVATGHFRNGILLAPATAQLIADLIQDKPPALDLTAFNPQR